ncbi:MAG TPA: acyl-CoA thioesterase [Ignavibacteriaceae bacterium]|nr:acyl-CoA thioesterase [Ignavibacteriaceae bacterium]
MFSVKRKINFYDCDAAGVLFFARIYELCHSAYEELIESFNLDEDYWNNEDYIVPIIKSEASYHKPLKYGDIVTVEIKVVQLKSSSFELNYECRNEKNEVTNKIKTVHVCADKKSWTKTTLNKKVFEGFSSHLTK